MKLHGNQAFANFIAAATAVAVTTTKNDQLFVSARIGKSSSSSQQQQQQQEHLRRAPIRKGYYDSTAPVGNTGFTQPLHNTNTQPQPQRRSSSSSHQDQHHYNRPATQAIDDSLTIPLNDVKRHVQEETEHYRLRNATTTTTTTATTIIIGNKNSKSNNATSSFGEEEEDDDVNLDAGVLSNKSTTNVSSPSGTPSAQHGTATAAAVTPPPGTCMIGYYDINDAAIPIPAERFIRETKGAAKYGLVFDAHTNTVVCNDDCTKFTFAYCNMKCNGAESCAKTWIEDAHTVECNGHDSCAGSHIDAYHVACNAERSCQGAFLGDDQFIYTLDCVAHDACSWSHVAQVKDLHCLGPGACYGAYVSGVESRVTCQSTPHEDGYYSPTCGGDKGFIEAEEGQSIAVLCNGDFSCIGYGHDAYAEELTEHPIYFDIDVGSHGELFCENSFAGNHDGGTYVCRYIDIIQGCANYNCHEPKGFNNEDDYRICNHIFSIHHHELCYGGYLNSDFVDDDDDDVNDDDTPYTFSAII